MFKPNRILFVIAVVILGISASLLMVTTLAKANQRALTSMQVLADESPLGSRLPVVNVEGFQNGGPVSNIQKSDNPPIPLHTTSDPSYAVSEITVYPYPPRAGEPTEICVELQNPTETPRDIVVHFGWARFGIGIPFTPINSPRMVHLPPHSIVTECIWWVPPVSGNVCVEVILELEGQEDLRSQRNIDVDEPLVPGEAHELNFPVGNPMNQPVSITLEIIPHVEGWGIELTTDMLVDMEPLEEREVGLTVVPPDGEPLPPDETIIADVEAFVEGELIGGFRKIHRPPVPLHPAPDPPYAEREITVHPYPPRAGEPTEVCVELRNPTATPQDVVVHFAWANFGIGLPFTPINGPRIVHLPPHSLVRECIWWVPPVSGNVCLEVILEIAGYEEQKSQRNIDVDEPLMSGVPHELIFPVGNPYDQPVSITLGTIHHVVGWEIELTTDLLVDMEPLEEREVGLTVVPPDGELLPLDETIIADVEAYVEGELIGGFRKIHRPPVPLHPTPDPPYAEREITVHPYPPRAGEPTEICVELRNPTPFPQDVWVYFAWANFGIGLPFTPINGWRMVHLPPHSIVRECIWWVPPVSGNICLEVILRLDGYEEQRSQRNIDVDEPLEPGVPHELIFPVRNPLDQPVSITLGTIHHVVGWEIELTTDLLVDMQPLEEREVGLTVVPPDGELLPPDETIIADVEAYVEGELIGGFRKIHRPPVPLHPTPDPPYAEREITVHPYPPRAGEPTEVCGELRNPTPFPQDVVVHFAWANFGIGIPFTPINGPRTVHLPPHSLVRECIWWVPPVDGHICLEVTLEMEGYEDQRSQRNIDIDEPLVPGVPHVLLFPVSNSMSQPVSITLGIIPHVEGWGIELTTDMLADMNPGEVREVGLTVVPPDGEPLPPDETIIADVEAYVEGELIGGFRKIHRPPVPLHPTPDPTYAEREITVHPYPPRAGEPTEVCVELRNPTATPQNVVVHFAWANFGIGIPFTPINGPRTVHLPPHSIVKECIWWIPPVGGNICLDVILEMEGYEEQRSQRNIDVDEPLEPLIPHSLIFPVGNPTTDPMSITLGLVPHLPDWEFELVPDTLPNMQAGEVREVTLTVTPPQDLPEDGAPIVDVEAFIEGELIGGFRKIFRPPVPVHRPKDPVYAESEIGIDPYPVVPSVPTMLSVELFNPTNQDRIVSVTFSVAPFGIGLPFDTSHITPNPINIFVPAFGAARGHVIWQPPLWHGKFCVQVTLEMDGYDPIWSRRNIDVGEPLQHGIPHSMEFPVGIGEHSNPMSVTLGMVKHVEGWDISLSEILLPDIQPGTTVSVTLTVTPPVDGPPLGSGDPIVDVEAFIDGDLLGGFRKFDIPPVPIHKSHEKGYAESEITIDPYPPQQGQSTTISTEVHNTSDEEMTIDLEFGWANFGFGIPFSTTGMTPYSRTVTLGPEMTDTISIDWVPEMSGHHCIIVHLTDPEGVYEPQQSQRNVDVLDQPPCGVTEVFTFTIYNDSPFSQTLDIGMMTFNVPVSWQVTTVPSGIIEVGPYATEVIEVHVTIPCPRVLSEIFDDELVYDILTEAGSLPIIDVEGYIDGELVGGIELRFPLEPGRAYLIYLPLILK